MRIKGFNHVGVTVKDLKRTIKWYNKNFGFKLVAIEALSEEEVEKLFPLYKVSNSTLKIGFLRMRGGGVMEIFQFSNDDEKLPLTWGRPGITHFTISVRGVAKWYKKLKANGVEFVTEPQRTSGADWVFMRDPDGNLVELIDLGVKYHGVKWLGGLIGSVLKKGSYSEYYGGD